jgi:hypothetical protein
MAEKVENESERGTRDSIEREHGVRRQPPPVAPAPCRRPEGHHPESGQRERATRHWQRPKPEIGQLRTSVIKAQ